MLPYSLPTREPERNSKLRLLKFRMLRAGSSKSPLQEKIARLEATRPAVAVVVENLVDGLLKGTQ